MQKTFAALAAAGALLIGGCSGSEEPVAVANTSNPTSTPTSTSPSSNRTGNDAVFIETVDPYWTKTYGTSTAIEFGGIICDALYDGVSKLDVLEKMTDTADGDFSQAVHIVHAAMTAYCPGFLTGSG